jgi:hypothetical protein
MTVNNVVYTVRTFVNLCALQANGSCIPGATEPSGNTKMYRVTVDAVWVPGKNLGCSAGGCDYTASSLIDPHGDPKFNSNISHPQITSVLPNTVGSGSTQTLTITGSAFVAGATVSIDTGAGTFQSVISNTGTQITVPFTAATPGSYTLAVTNPDGGRATVPLTVTAAPNITSVNPTSVSGGVQTTLTLAGTGFQTGASITASAGSVSNVTVTPSTSASLQLTAPTSGGTVTITLTNPDGGSGTINVAVVSAPNILSVTPNTVIAGSSQTITLSGTDFISGATLTTSAGSVSGFSVTNSTTATATFTAPATAQTVTLTLTNPDGGLKTITLTVNAAPVSITSINPSVGVPVNSANTTLTFTGTGFQAGAWLTVSSGTLSNFVVTNATTATVKYNAPSSAQTVTFTWHNPDGGTATKTMSVNVLPTITNLCSGNVASCAGTQSAPHNTANVQFTVLGTGFQAGATVTLTRVSNGSVRNSTVNSLTATKIVFTLTSATWNVTGNTSIQATVTNPDGGTVSQTFTVNLT